MSYFKARMQGQNGKLTQAINHAMLTGAVRKGDFAGIGNGAYFKAYAQAMRQAAEDARRRKPANEHQTNRNRLRLALDGSEVPRGAEHSSNKNRLRLALASL